MSAQKSFIVRLFPILQWSRTYTVEIAIGDMLAGFTVALTLIPQSMAYSALAGFDPQYGLYASFMGGFVYAFMGTCPQVNIGPSALLSLLTFTHTHGTNIDFAILLCFMTGIIQLITGIAQLGFVMDFVSIPVISGFTSAASLMVASSQIKGLLGIKFKAGTFVDTWVKIFKHVGETRITDTMLSLSCCTVLTIMQIYYVIGTLTVLYSADISQTTLVSSKISSEMHVTHSVSLGCTFFVKYLKKIPFKKPVSDGDKRRAARRAKIFWFIAISRNAVVVLLASVTAFLMFKSLNDPFYLTGPITPGLPTPRPPPFQSKIGNKVYTTRDMLSHLGVGLIVVPMIGILVNLAIAKAFARGKKVNATQEILATGLCSVVSSFFVSMPVNGSISRSAVSDASGVRTPGAGFYTGTLVIMTLLLLTPYFYYIPRAALSSVIVCAVLHMVETAIIAQLWKVSRIDLIPLVGCFFCSLGLGVEVGLLCGVGFDVLLLLYYNSRPPLDVKHVTDGILPPHYAIHPVGRLSFAGAERIRSKILHLTCPEEDEVPSSDDAASKTKPAKVLVVYCEDLYRLDYTFLQSLKMLETDWRPNSKIIFCNAKPSVKEQLKGVLTDSIYCDSGELRSHLSGAPIMPAAVEVGGSENTTV